ncbi:hypothetical protein [Aurantimonas sp. VKM B-3413]|uniref:hypothetical protein n=1 Tax=Aurantimonas sp. VKM B-3413 TaxID=2779401 RepID=UPI001E583FD5|nr:hypothetical protein [Aurantimonas sp. VKM B-3413]MCB8838707.1 hypothetical protein [Aurantimonas sp. VKM B-3413]
MSITMDDHHCFDEGRLAAAQGKKQKDCPYPKDSDKYDTWQEGFEHVTGSDEEGEPLED